MTQCKNFEICKSVLDTPDTNVCLSCQMVFGTSPYTFICRGRGTLIFRDNVDCPVCLEDTKQGVSQPRCEHFTCVDCFKRCYYGDTSSEPPFPYPAIEQEYINSNDEYGKWEIDYPLILPWCNAFNKWNELQDEKYRKESHLRVCPLCRA